MSLAVMIGLSRHRVAQDMRDAVCRAAAEGRTVLLAVPGDADAIAARDAVAAYVQAGVRVATLDGVVQAEWALRGDGRRLARGLARDVLLARALVSTGVPSEPGRGAVALLGTLAERSVGATMARGTGSDLSDRVVAAVRAYGASLKQHGMLERGEICEHLARQSPPAAVVAVDGFVSLPPAFEWLLVAWAAAGAEVLLAVPWEPDRAGTAASTPLIQRLVGVGATLHSCAEDAPDGPPELDRVRRELFTGTAPGPAQGAVSLAVAEGEEAEARHIAAVVAGLVAAGASAGDIVVAYADVARHRSWISRALDDEGISADIEACVGAGETAFGGALLAMRRCVAQGFPREAVSTVVRNRFSGVGEAAADAADADWRRARSAGGRSLVRRFTALEGTLGELVSLSGRPVGVAEARRWKKLADTVLANGYGSASPTPGLEAATDAAAHRTFCRLVEEAVELGESGVDPEDLWRSFEFARIQSAQSRPDESLVLVTGIDDVPATERRHVILGGLAASELPRQGSEERLEGDSIARAAARLGIALDPTQHLREERRAFYLAVCTARATLTLVRRGSDDEGAPVRESVFWDEFLDLYRRPGEAVSATAGVPITTEAEDAAQARGSRRIERGAVSDEVVLQDLAGIRELSPSEIETYLACPYKWYVERRVRAQTPDRAVDAALAGRLAHDVLARFYREWWALGRTRVTPGTAGEALAMATRIAEQAVGEAGQPDTLEGATLLSTVPRSVAALVERDASFLPGYAPEHVEWEFGRAATAPAVDLGGVSLIGRADRIDVGPEGIVVVDYKRTHAAPLAEIRRDRLVQLQLYAVAASRTMGLPVAGGLYRGLKERADRGFVLGDVPGSFKRTDVTDAAGMEVLLRGAVDAAVQAADDMRHGRIQATPSVRACAYCQAVSFCGRTVS